MIADKIGVLQLQVEGDIARQGLRVPCKANGHQTIRAYIPGSMQAVLVLP